MKIFKTLLLSFISIAAGNLAPSLWGWNMQISDNFSFSYIYGPGAPDKRPPAPNLPSACNNAGNVDEYSYFCPHMLMFSTDMLLASWYDGLSDNFYYAVAGGSSDSQCGQCFQVKPTSADIWKDSLYDKQLIIQIDNFGYDVAQGQFDISMGDGGTGWFTANHLDCKYYYCNGGPCGNPMYDGLWKDWQPDGNCYGGGLKIEPNKSDDEIWEECKKLTGKSFGYKDQTLWQSCFFSRTLYYHQNFYSYESLQVKCPDGLTKLTGLKRTDDVNLPSPNINNVLTRKEGGRVVISTTQDSCKPACSYQGKGAPDSNWPTISTCSWNGLLN